MIKKIVFVVLAFGLWLLFTWSTDLDNLIAGMAVAVVTGLLFSNYFPGEVDKLLQPSRYFWFVIYIFIFTWECIKANFELAYPGLHPDLPINPAIVKVKTTLKSQLGRTTLANSITMTPGTITVDIIGNDVYVHWIYMNTTDPKVYTREIAGRFEKYIKKIFE